MSIKCQVEECSYNENSQRICKASDIEVRSSGTKSVNTSDNTACNTFQPKNR